MQGRLGAVLTSGLAAIAVALALLQAFVVSRSHLQSAHAAAAIPLAPSNRYSAPGGRSAIPWAPFDRVQQKDEARSPAQKHEERRAPPPPPSRFHGFPPHQGPAPARKATV